MSLPVVVIAEIRSSSSAAVTNVVHSLPSLKIPFHQDHDGEEDDADEDEQRRPVKFSGLERAPCSRVSSGQSLGGDVVVLPCAENVPDHNLIMIMIIQVQDCHDHGHDQDYDDQVVPSAKIIPYDDDDEDDDGDYDDDDDDDYDSDDGNYLLHG